MGKNTITALLTDLRALILSSRPAYRDFLGEATETKTTKILENVVLAESQLMLPVADAAFSGFIAGRAYRVMLNGEEESVIAKDFSGAGVLSNVEDFLNPPNDYWALRFDSEAGKMIALTAGTFLDATISVYYDKAVTTQRWSVKKLAYELLPDRLLSALSAAANTARKALTAANAAQSTANAAQSTANAAQSTANAAQSTANAAQSTADTAQSTADAAKILPVQYNYFAGLYSKYNSLLGWYQAYPVLDYRESDGYFYKSSWERQPIAKNDIPNSFFCRTAKTVDGRNSDFEMLLHSSNMTGNKWGVIGIAIADDGRLYQVKSNGIPRDDTQGIQLVFSPPNVSLLASSTLGSTKKFKITVDDTGTLSATAVTDTTT